MQLFHAVQLPPLSASAELQEGQGSENRVIFTGADAEQAMRRTRERLEDPAQRRAMREEQRVSVRQQHPDLARALRIDPATEDRLIEVLTDQHMDRMERIHTRDRDDPAGFAWRFQEQADAETGYGVALRELLGEEGLERYRHYIRTLGARMQTSMFDAQLPASAKLRDDQQDRLIDALHEHTRHDLEAAMPSRFATGLLLPDRMLSLQEIQRQSQLATIEANEESWRRMQESNRLLSQRVAEFLSPVQLSVFDEMNAQRARQLQQWIEGARAQAGLDAAIPAIRERAVPEQQRTPIVGYVQLEIEFTVNSGEPITVTQVVRNGEPVMLEAGDGLWVEATPTLYDDHWFSVGVAYYEEDGSGKRGLLHGGGAFGGVSRLPNGAPGRTGGGTVVTGSKGYWIEAMASATAL